MPYFLLWWGWMMSQVKFLLRKKTTQRGYTAYTDPKKKVFFLPTSSKNSNPKKIHWLKYLPPLIPPCTCFFFFWFYSAICQAQSHNTFWNEFLMWSNEAVSATHLAACLNLTHVVDSIKSAEAELAAGHIGNGWPHSNNALTYWNNKRKGLQPVAKANSTLRDKVIECTYKHTHIYTYI